MLLWPGLLTSGIFTGLEGEQNMFSFPWAWKDGGKDPCVDDFSLVPFSIVVSGLTVVAMAGDAPFTLGVCWTSDSGWI